jgi:hypothetical protein
MTRNIARNATSFAMGIAGLTLATQCAFAEPKSAEQAKKDCDAKGSFYTLSPAHKAGEVNAKTGTVYKRDSSGVCRFNTAKAKEALAGK